MDNLNLDAGMTHISRVRAWLGKLPAKEIEFDSIAPIVKEIGVLDESQVRGTLKYLETLGEIKIKHKITPGGRKFMRGIELVKVTSSNQIIEESAEKIKHSLALDPIDYRIDENRIPKLVQYMRQKVAVSTAAQILRDAGLDTTNIYKTMESDEWFDEGIYLMQQIEHLSMMLNSISKQRDDAVIDMQKEREMADYWRSKIRTLPETQRNKFEAEAPWNQKSV